jgi:hypothetical protein
MIYPLLLAGKQAKLFSPEETKSVCASVVDGYSFPTNLDLDSPLTASTPETVQVLIERALNEEWSDDRFCECLDETTKRRLA